MSLAKPQGNIDMCPIPQSTCKTYFLFGGSAQLSPSPSPGISPQNCLHHSCVAKWRISPQPAWTMDTPTFISLPCCFGWTAHTQPHPNADVVLLYIYRAAYTPRQAKQQKQQQQQRTRKQQERREIEAWAPHSRCGGGREWG